MNLFRGVLDNAIAIHQDFGQTSTFKDHEFIRKTQFFWTCVELFRIVLDLIHNTQNRIIFMDSEVVRDGRLMDIIDEKWREDKLPQEDIAVPQMELPELEPDNGPTNETLREQEQKWLDLALSSLHENPPTTTSS